MLIYANLSTSGSLCRKTSETPLVKVNELLDILLFYFEAEQVAKLENYLRRTLIFLEIGKKIQWNSVITNSVVNEHSVITNRYLSQIS
jgi:hypothetical protein